MVMNFVIKANISTHSNLHFVYAISKGVNGKIFNNAIDLLEFKSDDITDTDLAEIYYDNSFFVKYDFAIRK